MKKGVVIFIGSVVAVCLVAVIIFLSTSGHTGKDGYFSSIKEEKVLTGCTEKFEPGSAEWKQCAEEGLPGYDAEPEVEIQHGTVIP